MWQKVRMVRTNIHTLIMYKFHHFGSTLGLNLVYSATGTEHTGLFCVGV